MHPAASAAAALVLLVPAIGRGDTPHKAALKRAADEILRFQAPDGAIAMTRMPASDTRVIPYFASFAARGLMLAHTQLRDARYLDASRRWAAWYEQHMNPDGTVYDYTGPPGAWKPTGDYDSTDSYAATFLDLLAQIQRASPNAKWLAARGPAIAKAVAAIKLTLQPIGLTIAKPTYPVMYTMDNTETAHGLRSAEWLAGRTGQRELAAEARALAARMEHAVATDLWDAPQHRYLVAIQTDGARIDGLSKWYPDIMANLMAIAWLPPSQQNRDLYDRLKTQLASGLPDKVVTPTDTSRLIWWGLAAQGAGDHAMSARIAMALASSIDGIVARASSPDLGHICCLLVPEASRGL